MWEVFSAFGRPLKEKQLVLSQTIFKHTRIQQQPLKMVLARHLEIKHKAVELTSMWSDHVPVTPMLLD